MDGYQYICCLPPAGGRIRSQGNKMHRLESSTIGVAQGRGWGYEAYEVKNKREKLRCLLLRREKKNIIYLFMK